ncbi:hypothetical protein BCR42DRAFT_321046 [Absidia repens]|uniref:DUF155 domain-containing protein n=1 Tax=Absidia repens TaxID=90262 RepID=A0A1X2ISM8_9FUNG|nr:hypothetical protein BCR42DRAFT_321046 [Absidia repens]
MKQPSSTEGSSKAGKLFSQTKASAISKHLLKSNPIPQQLINKNLAVASLRKPKGHPLRSSKISQKLVLFPQSSTELHDVLGEEYHQTSTNDADFWRPHHVTGIALPTEWTFESRTDAERMPKDERDFAQLPRVAAYCTSEGYNLTRLRHFLRHYHHVSPRQYDEALYAAYHFPLMTLRPEKDNFFRVRTVAHQTRENEELDMNYDEDHMDQEETPMVIDSTFPRPGYPFPTQHHQHRSQPYQHHKKNQHVGEQYHDENNQQHEELENYTEPQQEKGRLDENHGQQEQEDTIQQISHRKPFTGGEVFVFDYGVVVFWNFCRTEELLMLEDLADYSIRPFRDNPDEDIQIEEMHFQYDTSQLKPRIFNDMITMKTGNHMIKLTLSHGLSQSAEMAETGRLGKTRVEITTINGRLFNLRMNVNLVSNVLDTPEIFWSEPALQPMYNAIREYLEIPQRAKILNDRLRVISDLLSMLRDHLTNFGVEYQTLIIIYLIIIAVVVACFEISVKVLQSIRL